MAYDKKDQARYENFGGINTKISPYLNSQLEFLNIENMDFQTPGSLTKRWGSTQYFGASLSGKVNGLYQFTQTSGASVLYVAAGGTLGMASSSGFSAVFSGSTAGSSYFGSFGSSFIDGVSLASLDLDFDNLQNNAFLANGKQAFKSTGGSSFVFFGLPRFQSLWFSTSAQTNNIATGFTGYYYYKVAYVNSYGLQGAPSQIVTLSSAPTIGVGSTQFIVSLGNTSGLGLIPPNTDISGIAFFRTDAQAGFGGTTIRVIQTGAFGQTTNLFVDIDNLNYNLAGVVGVSAGSQGVTFVDTNIYGGITLLNNNIIPWNWYPQSQFWQGLTATVGFGLTLIPKFFETHDAQLFFAGMSYAQSTVYYSEFSEPEHFEPDFNFEVRTNDGQGVSGLKSYNGNLMVFKPSSFHSLNTSSDDPANWSLTQVSSEYGCLGNRAVAEYSDLLVFLDRKGIIRFNGANIEILSTKIDPIFQRMNVSACKENACITYDKQRNQILCDIPVDGSTMANLTVVYDIVSNAWTTYRGYNPSVTIRSQIPGTDSILVGGYTGLVSYFGPSFFSDNGVGFTTVAKSGYMADMGHSVSKLYRRLFVDSVPVGSSSAITVNFYQDYGSSVVFSASYFQSPFQNRIEYGIPAKSMAVEFVMGSTYPFQLMGFDSYFRFLRPF